MMNYYSSKSNSLYFAICLHQVVWTVICVELKISNGREIIWCTISQEEQNKCLKLSEAVEENMKYFGDEYRKIKCFQASNKEECIVLIDKEKCDLASTDAGLLFIASRYHSLIPILQEIYRNGKFEEHSIALIKHGSLPDVRTLKDLKGKKACFPAVGTLAGWFIPVNTLMNHGGMEILDCNNHIKTVSKFFGPSCSPNALINKYNPGGDNSNKLCSICGSKLIGEKCTAKDSYYGYDGAIRCLMDKGDVAFVKHSAVESRVQNEQEIFYSGKFQLLCPDGTRKSINDYTKCSWGRVPSDVIVTTTAKNQMEKQSYQNFFKRMVEIFSDTRQENIPINGTVNSRLHLNSSLRNDFQSFHTSIMPSFRKNLLLQDSTNNFQIVTGSRQLFSVFLNENLNQIFGVHRCPISRMTLCVSSEIELQKCRTMKIALNAQMLKPQMNCFWAESQIKCMESIKNKLADVAVFDASDVYDAGKYYDLIPFMSEVYDLEKPEYYVVAVVKEEDPSTDLTYLKNKYTCHTGINMAAGWTIPLAVLISKGWIRNYECNAIHTASEYFTKSCVPGSLNYEYTKDRTHDNLCGLCHSSTYRLCKRNPTEDYFGNTGAFRCLVEGAGQVAFVKHTTIFENTDGKKKDFWARNIFLADFELLCIDGGRAEVKDYKKCSLGKVKANAIVTRGGKDLNETETMAFINLFSYAQQYYGRKSDDYLSFGLFSSPSPYSDIIFQDATTRLQVIPQQERHFATYLGDSFLRAKKIVDCR